MRKEKEVKDEEAILGSWKVVTFDVGPVVDIPAEKVANMRYTFEKDGRLVSLTGSKEELIVSYTLDATVTPKAIDLKYPSCTFLGIYKLDGDTLTLCVHQVTKSVRPTEFKPDSDKYHALITLKRVKDEKKDK